MKSLNISRKISTNKYKEIEQEIIINKLKKTIDRLKSQINSLFSENEELKTIKSEYFVLKQKASNIEDLLKKRDAEKLKITQLNGEELLKLINEKDLLENLLKSKEIEYSKNSLLYHQKMENIKFIEMENKVYAEEVSNFNKEKEKYYKEKDDEINEYKIKCSLKYEKFKKKMNEDMEKMNKNLTNINSEFLSTNYKLLLIKNKKLIVQIGELQKTITELKEENKKLKLKTIQYENEVDIHRLIERNLSEKCEKSKTKSSNQNIKRLVKLVRNKSDMSNSDNYNKSCDIRTTFFNKTNGTLSTNTIANNSRFFEKRLLNYEKRLQDKNYENEMMTLANSHLKNKLDLYQKKFNGLFKFLEDCLNEFFKDDEIKKNKHLNIKIEDIKNCDFNRFNPEEKYALLVILMKYLLPLVTVNFNSTNNIGVNLFKTNINLFDKKFNLNETYLKDDTLKNAFVDKKSRYFKDVLNHRHTQFSSSVPVIKNIKSVDYDFYQSKSKAIY